MQTDIELILQKYKSDCSTENKKKLQTILKREVREFKKQDIEKYNKTISFDDAIHQIDYCLSPFKSKSNKLIRSFNNKDLKKLNDANRQVLRDFLQEQNTSILIEKQNTEIIQTHKDKILNKKPDLKIKLLSGNPITKILAEIQLHDLIREKLSWRFERRKTEILYVVLDKPSEPYKTVTFEDLCKLLLESQINCTYCNNEMLLFADENQSCFYENQNFLISFDAIIPIKGHTKDNLAICCFRCNSKKGTPNNPINYQCLDIEQKDFTYIAQNDLSDINKLPYRLEKIKIDDNFYWYEHTYKQLYSYISEESGNFIKDYELDGSECHKSFNDEGEIWLPYSDFLKKKEYLSLFFAQNESINMIYL
jgi:hypothetical protein